MRRRAYTWPSDAASYVRPAAEPGSCSVSPSTAAASPIHVRSASLSEAAVSCSTAAALVVCETCRRGRRRPGPSCPSPGQPRRLARPPPRGSSCVLVAACATSSKCWSAGRAARRLAPLGELRPVRRGGSDRAWPRRLTPNRPGPATCTLPQSTAVAAASSYAPGEPPTASERAPGAPCCMPGADRGTLMGVC
jgi:hypothetical protein